MNEDGKILGMPRKTALLVIGGAVVLVVVVMWLRGRSGAPAEAGAPWPQGGGGGASGAVQVSPGGAYDTGAAQANLALEGMKQRQGFEAQLADLQIAGEKNRQATYQAGQELGLQIERERSQREATYYAGIMPGQIATANAAAAADQARLAGDKATYDVIQRSVAGKKKVECPPGQHLVVTPESGPVCQPLGGGGFSFGTVFHGIGQVVTGVFQGAAAAAPGIGYAATNAAAQYGMAQAGILNTPYATSPTTARKAGSGGNASDHSSDYSGAAATGPSYSTFQAGDYLAPSIG